MILLTGGRFRSMPNLRRRTTLPVWVTVSVSALPEVGVMAILDVFENEVMRLWSEILGVEVTSADQDFFELGGQSLAMVQFLAMVESEFQIELPVEVLFVEGLTVAEAARALGESARARVTAGEGS